jgi:hypothetical protein
MNEQQEFDFFFTKLRHMTLPAELPSSLEHHKELYEALKENLLNAKERKDEFLYLELIDAFEENLKKIKQQTKKLTK